MSGHQLTELRIGDDPASWADAGFTVDGAAVHLGHTRISLLGKSEPRGIASMAIDGVDTDIDSLPVHHGADLHAAEHEHANLVDAIDHVVVMTPDSDRTTTALERAGLEARRIRTFDVGGMVRRQTFFWMGDVILELVGGDEPTGTGPPALWGLALTSPDLDATAAALGAFCGPPKPAVQQGRRIATLKTRDLDISTAVAIMSPHPKASNT